MNGRHCCLTVATVLSCFIFLAPAGCQKIQKMLPATTVDTPDKESPEWVVQQVLKAAMDPNEPRAWAAYRQFLHPKGASTPRALAGWRSNNFPTLRRKWDLFVVNDDGDHCRGAATKCDPTKTKPHYKKDYDAEYNDGRGLKIFVVNKGNPDYPTPCNLLKTNDGKWRVHMGCLN